MTASSYHLVIYLKFQHTKQTYIPIEETIRTSKQSVLTSWQCRVKASLFEIRDLLCIWNGLPTREGSSNPNIFFFSTTTIRYDNKGKPREERKSECRQSHYPCKKVLVGYKNTESGQNDIGTLYESEGTVGDEVCATHQAILGLWWGKTRVPM